MLVIPVTHEGKIVLVKVFRPGLATWCWEIPQERMDQDDDITVAFAAKRCAREEIGLVGEPTEIIELAPNASFPDRATEVTYPVIVRGTFDFDVRIDKGEVLNGCIQAFTEDEIVEMIKSGEIQCPCTISAFFKYLLKKMDKIVATPQ